MNETQRYFKDACLSWERLRIIYTIIITLGFIARLYPFEFNPVIIISHIFNSMNSFFIFAFTILFMNAFYCVGPLIEIYAFAFFGKRFTDKYRYGLFASGLVLSLFLLEYSGCIIESQQSVFSHDSEDFHLNTGANSNGML